MTDKIYLVTGAAGFLGGNVCRQLIDRGENVRALVLPGDKAMKFVPEKAEIVKGDLLDTESLERFFDVPKDTEINVIHCASIVTTNPEYSQKVMDVNVGGTRNIISQCLSHSNFHRLVYVSSTGCIPENPKKGPIKEISHFSAEGITDCYSQSKAIATQEVLDAVKNKGLNACVVHPTGIMGPEDYAVGYTTKVLAELIRGEMKLAVSGTFNLVDVRDLAAGTIAACDRGRKGECYILGNEVVSFKDFSHLVSEESGGKKIRFFIPGKIAYHFAKMAERRAERKGKKAEITSSNLYNLIRNNQFDSSKAAAELGYKTRPYRETIRDEVAWMKSFGLI